MSGHSIPAARVYCLAEFTSQEHSVRYDLIVRYANEGIRLRNSGKLKAAATNFAECLSRMERETGPASPFVAVILKSIIIMQLENIGGNEDYKVVIKLAERAVNCIINGLTCEKATSEERRNLEKQLVMIYDYKRQAEVKLGRIEDARASENMKSVVLSDGLSDQPKYENLVELARRNKILEEKCQASAKQPAVLSMAPTMQTSPGASPPLRLLPCDVVICHAVSRWQSVDTKIHGYAARIEEKKEHTLTPSTFSASDPSAVVRVEAVSSVTLLKPQLGFKSQMRTLSDFIKGSPMKLDDPCGWFARMKLRYSCSSLTVAFVGFIAPELARQGIAQLQVNAGGTGNRSRLVEMKDLAVWTVVLEPRKRYMIEYSPRDTLDDEVKRHLGNHPSILNELDSALRSMWERPIVQEVVEGDLTFCTHNVLRCKKSGLVIDLSGGQFTGTMQPAVYMDAKSFYASLPGKVLEFIECPESAVQGQIARDVNLAQQINPSYHPKEWATCVVASSVAGMDDGKYWETVCRGCLATPCQNIGSSLFRCGRCGLVLYCCQDCQRHDWKRHRQECQKR
jgi:hypothetical protein